MPFPSLDDVYLAITQEKDNRISSVNQESCMDGVSFIAQTTSHPRNLNNEKSILPQSPAKAAGELDIWRSSAFTLLSIKCGGETDRETMIW